MDLLQKIETDLTEATKNRDEIIVSVLRMLKSSIKNQEIEKKRQLEGAEISNILEKQAKQRQDSIEQYTNGNRTDLAQKEEIELKIINKYLPKKISQEETEKLVEMTIKSLKATSMKDMGQVIKEVMSKANGQVEGKVVSELVRAKLA